MASNLILTGGTTPYILMEIDTCLLLIIVENTIDVNKIVCRYNCCKNVGLHIFSLVLKWDSLNCNYDFE